MLSSRFLKLFWVPAAFAVLGCVPYQTYQQNKKELQTDREAYQDLSRKYNEALMRLANGDSGAGAEASELKAQLLELQHQRQSGKRLVYAQRRVRPGNCLGAILVPERDEPRPEELVLLRYTACRYGHHVGGLAQAMVELLGDDERRVRMGRAGRAHVEEHFRWDLAAARTEAVYRKVLEGKG